VHEVFPALAFACFWAKYTLTAHRVSVKWDQKFFFRQIGKQDRRTYSFGQRCRKKRKNVYNGGTAVKKNFTLKVATLHGYK
jgi:hypothetical protein